MTDINPIKKPPQSMFHPEDDMVDLNEVYPEDDMVELNVVELDEESGHHERNTTEKPSLPSTTSSKPSLQFRLDSATLKVDNASKLADIVMLRMRGQLAQYKESLNQAAIRIDKENAAEMKAFQQRRQRMSLMSEREKETAKQNEKLLQLEKLKVEVMDAKLEERRKLRILVRREKEIVNNSRRDEEETPTQILNNSNYFTIDEDDNDIDDSKTLRHNGKQLYDDVAMETEEKPRHQENHEHHQQSEKVMTIEEKRLAARAEAAEEIRQAKEVRRHEMAKFAKEREEIKLAEGSDNKVELQQTKFDKNIAEELVGGVTISTLCKVLECVEEELFDLDSSDLSFEPTIEITENSSSYTDTDIVPCTIAEHVQAIAGYDTRLSDIELMQSIILAENAALIGKDEFKLGSGEQLNNVMHKYSVSPPEKEHNRSSIQREPPRGNFAPRFGSISKRAGLAMKSFRLAAAKVDKHQRIGQKRRVTAQ